MKIAIFASGNGSNAQKIMAYFQNKAGISVALLVASKRNAPVLDKAKAHQIPSLVLQKKRFYQTEELLQQLVISQIDFIVLAGFLWLVPAYLVRAYAKRIINIHPALLPKFGGKGMYGMNVHRAVVEAQESVSGITIHYVNEAYDEGSILFQASCPLTAEDRAEDVARKVQSLEHQYFSPIIEAILPKAVLA
ncbi:MAG: phosphoribosylglycinamide formyltransferase [Bacteroidota bacterium]